MLLAGLLLICSPLWPLWADPTAAIPFAHVDTTQGGVTFEGKKLSAMTEISREGTVETDARGSVQITLLPSHVKLLLGHSTRFLLTRPESSGQQTHTLEGGVVRAKVTPSKDHTIYFKIKTRSAAVMGARGTDFIALANPALDESELVVLDGQVDLAPEADPTNLKIVSRFERSGMGGRFGDGPTKPVTLTKKAVKYYESLVPLEDTENEETRGDESAPSKDAPAPKSTANGAN